MLYKFTFRALSRCFCPKRLTKSSFVTRKKPLLITVNRVKKKKIETIVKQSSEHRSCYLSRISCPNFLFLCIFFKSGLYKLDVFHWNWNLSILTLISHDCLLKKKHILVYNDVNKTGSDVEPTLDVCRHPNRSWIDTKIFSFLAQPQSIKTIYPVLHVNRCPKGLLTRCFDVWPVLLCFEHPQWSKKSFRSYLRIHSVNKRLMIKPAPVDSRQHGSTNTSLKK